MVTQAGAFPANGMRNLPGSVYTAGVASLATCTLCCGSPAGGMLSTACHGLGETGKPLFLLVRGPRRDETRHLPPWTYLSAHLSTHDFVISALYGVPGER